MVQAWSINAWERGGKRGGSGGRGRERGKVLPRITNRLFVLENHLLNLCRIHHHCQETVVIETGRVPHPHVLYAVKQISL